MQPRRRARQVPLPRHRLQGAGCERDHTLRVVGREALRNAAQGVDLALELAGVLRFAGHMIDEGLSLLYPFQDCAGIGAAGPGNPGLGQQQVRVLGHLLLGEQASASVRDAVAVRY